MATDRSEGAEYPALDGRCGCNCTLETLGEGAVCSTYHPTAAPAATQNISRTIGESARAHPMGAIQIPAISESRGGHHPRMEDRPLSDSGFELARWDSGSHSLVEGFHSSQSSRIRHRPQSTGNRPHEQTLAVPAFWAHQSDHNCARSPKRRCAEG